jgi:hypothetical protein
MLRALSSDTILMFITVAYFHKCPKCNAASTMSRLQVGKIDHTEVGHMTAIGMI